MTALIFMAENLFDEVINESNDPIGYDLDTIYISTKNKGDIIEEDCIWSEPDSVKKVTIVETITTTKIHTFTRIEDKPHD